VIVVCQYCLKPAELVTGAAVHPKLPLLRSKQFWHCAPCKAWVGCKPGTQQPIGTLANRELRVWRLNAHNLFDPLWSRPLTRHPDTQGRGQFTRTAAYEWLREVMGLSEEECHIEMMNVEQCKKVVKLCKEKRGLA
jgi:hypothetical protein